MQNLLGIVYDNFLRINDFVNVKEATITRVDKLDGKFVLENEHGDVLVKQRRPIKSSEIFYRYEELHFISR